MFTGSHNIRLTKNEPKRHSVSIIEGELTKQPCSPFSKDRYFTNEKKKTPTKSPQGRRPPPIPTKKRESPYKSPISTPKKEKKFTVDRQVLDAPNIMDNAPNNVISFNKKGELVVALTDGIYIWRADADPEYFMESTTAIDCVQWVNESLLALSTQGEVEIWNVLDHSKEQKLASHRGHVNCIAVGAEQRIATAGVDMVINVTDLKTSKVEPLIGHHHEIVGLGWSPDCMYLASCDKKGVLIVWGNKKRKKFHIDYPVSSITWISQSIIAVGGMDPEGTLRFVNIICPEEETKTTKTGFPISCLSWQPKRGLLVAHRSPPYEWELYGKDLTLVDSFAKHNGDLLNITSTHDGKIIATISSDEQLILWFFKDKKVPLVHAASNSVFTQLR